MHELIGRANRLLDRYPRLSTIFLRMGLATVFIYAALGSTLSPNNWIGYLPPFFTAMFPAPSVLMVFSIVELALAVWLLSGVYVRYAALVSFFMLGGIVLSNFALLDISFRDIGLMFAALALACLPANDDERESV